MKIGIAGKMASGKTTVADNLCKHYGFVKFSLATKLKALCALHQPGWEEDGTFPVVLQHVQDLLPHDDFRTTSEVAREIIGVFHDIPVVEGKNRRLLQVVGTDVIRKYHENAWVDYLVRHIEEQMVPNAVIDDVRFPNEVRDLRTFRYRVVRLRVDEDERISRLEDLYGRKPTDEELQHPSEIALDDMDDDEFDYVLSTDYPESEQLSHIADMLGEI
jgi:hypothetical protein